MSRDNVAGISGGLVKNIFLLPGRIIQWFMYIFVAGMSYGKLRQQTRLARSPIITWLFSIVGWIVIFIMSCDYLGLDLTKYIYLIEGN